MEWTESIRRAIEYIEQHLTEDIHAEDVAARVYISPFYFQKGFSILTGYTVGEYIRNRRLYLAALDIAAGEDSIAELAYKYCYETPESFAKAFRRFHGVNPAVVRKNHSNIRIFLPLQVSIQIKGGSEINCVVEEVPEFTVIGFANMIDYGNSAEEIIDFWNCFYRKYRYGQPQNDEVFDAVRECGVGKYAVCIPQENHRGKFCYFVAGDYDGRKIPEGMEIFTVPAQLWAKFSAEGALPGAIRSLNSAVYHQWLPGNSEYETADCRVSCVEWYSEGDIDSPAYKSGLWIPVKKK